MEYRYSAVAALPLTPSADDTPTPPVTVHGNGISEYNFSAIRVHDHPTRWVMASSVLLLVLFGLGAAGLATTDVGVAEGMFLWGILAVAFAVATVGRHYRKQTAVQRDIHARRLYTAAVAGGVTTTVYPDRIEQASARWRQTVVFNQGSRFVENRDWFFVETDGVRAIVAAGDVTPWEAQAMYEHIARAIPPNRQFQRGQFAARREESAPPPFSAEPPVCYERVAYREEEKRGVAWPRGLLPWLFVPSLIVSGMFTVLFQVTPLFFLDYLLFFTACFGGVLAVTLAVLHLRRETKSHPVSALDFTADGLRIERADGSQEFAAAADVHARRTPDGVRLFTPAGVFTVPWSATVHRQQLEWMLFHQRPTSF